MGKAADVIRRRTRRTCLPIGDIVGSEQKPTLGTVDPADSTDELARESLLQWRDRTATRCATGRRFGKC
jgi:hypothetical protein